LDRFIHSPCLVPYGLRRTKLCFKMPCCAIITCHTKSQTSSIERGGISFHRFPKEPNAKEKWIDVTGRGNWMPTKNSTICSKHFAEKDFIIKKSGYRYLKPGAIPRIKIVQICSSYLSEPEQTQGGGGGEGVAPASAPSEEQPTFVVVKIETFEPISADAETEQPEGTEKEASADKPVENNQTETKAGNTDDVIDNNAPAIKIEGDWQQREKELLEKINELEKVKSDTAESGLRLELKVKEEEIDLLKARVKNLETELQAALAKPGGKNQDIINSIKLQHEELLSKARGMIFDKTKLVKNQELQIEALTTQVASLKDINQITKDLLEIRNSEVKAMEDRFQAMEARYKAEKERYDLVLKRAQTSTTINDDLKKEYETQLAIFKELREKYEQRVKALVAENERLKAPTQGGSST
ncbi:THAP domain-containing protein 5, partial [Bombyx mandarina]|uniref:THAP domain-containing protein 5 n=1 Tax=Bombyx mandarina TaxID=7092 RepID=A0A6J2KVR8_BOMMA